MITAMPVKPIHRTPIAAPRLPIIKVMGLGGGGSNAINRMIELGLSGIEFIAANSDSQALKSSLAPTKIQLGPQITRGLGAGGDPTIGEAAAEESFKEISQALAGADMVFLTAGMGGGTGTGAIPIAARAARSLGMVTTAIVSTPFSFEVGRRQRNAREGLARLRPFTDTLITVPNDRLLQIAPRDLTLDLAFRLADDVLRQGIQGITELVTQPGIINVDFAHVRQLMKMGGGSLLSIGYGEGIAKAHQAIDKALHHPLLDEIALEDATGIIANFTAGPDLTFQEVAEALTYLSAKTNNQAEIIPGVISDERMQNRVQVILVITGLGATPLETKAETKKAGEANPALAAVTTVGMDTSPSYPAHAVSAPAAPAAAGAPAPVRERSHIEFAASPTNLDLPAFMRRRSR